ncbi:MAG TPA: MlaD family protein [Cellvibrionaceae bacterium]
MNLSKPMVTPFQKLSPVWLIPIVALIIALWLAINSWQEKGQDIEILLNAAAGIEVGKTQVRLKDVPVGKVSKMQLTADLSKVRLRVTLEREIAKHLSANTRFWLVSPRISVAGVSNLGTLVSGVYIVMDPGEPGPFSTNFDGLPEPPAIESSVKGTTFLLRADSLDSVDMGSPVYYRQLKVGEVTSYKLSEIGDAVEIRVFVQAPHDKLISTHSRFWNVSGVDINLGPDGVKAQVASLVSFLGGGIAFENVNAYENAEPAKANQTFFLYADKESVLEGRFNAKFYYLLKFSHSVRGLKAGAPVEFRGIKVGEVVDVVLSSIENHDKTLLVYITLEPERFKADLEPKREVIDDMVARMVEQGLRGQLRTASLLTGSLYVDLAFENKQRPGKLLISDNHSEIPTLDDPLDQLSKQISEITDKFNRIPSDKIGADLAKSMASLASIMNTLEKNNTAGKLDGTLGNIEKGTANLDKTMAEATQTLAQLRVTLKSLDTTFAPDSQLHFEIIEMLNSVTEAADSFDRIADQLKRYPNALIFGGQKKE